MAKRMKKTEEKIVIREPFEPKAATVDGREWTLEQNEGTKRFDLKVDGNLIFSDVHHASCNYIADSYGIKW